MPSKATPIPPLSVGVCRWDGGCPESWDSRECQGPCPLTASALWVSVCARVLFMWSIAGHLSCCSGCGQLQHQFRIVPPFVSIAACKRFAALVRKHVSKQGAGKGKAILECLELTREQIQLCYQSNPLNEVEAIQDGLHKWSETHRDRCTWEVLLKAMADADIAQQHCRELVEELHSMDAVWVRLPLSSDMPGTQMQAI